MMSKSYFYNIKVLREMCIISMMNQTSSHILNRYHFNGSSVSNTRIVEQSNKRLAVLCAPEADMSYHSVNAGLPSHIENNGMEETASLLIVFCDACTGD